MKKRYKKRQKRYFRVTPGVMFQGQTIETVLANRHRVLAAVLSRTPDKQRQEEIQARFRAGDERIRRLFAS